MVSYKILGGGTSKRRTQGSVVELLLDIPYFDSSRSLPSLDALNEMFAKGIKDAGMSGGCEWKPFQITPEEYDEVVEELLTHPRMKELRV